MHIFARPRSFAAATESRFFASLRMTEEKSCAVSGRLLLRSPQHQRRILRPERDAVAHRVLDRSFSSDLRHIIQIAIGIRFFQIDGRRNLPVMHGNEGSCNSRSSRRALRMPNLRLQARHRRAVRAISQRQLQARASRCDRSTPSRFRAGSHSRRQAPQPRHLPSPSGSRVPALRRIFLQTHAMKRLAG